MATRTTTPLGAPVWIDLATSDVAGAQAFYRTVMGWDYEKPSRQRRRQKRTWNRKPKKLLDGRPAP